jgi:hypothetical protein
MISVTSLFYLMCIVFDHYYQKMKSRLSILVLVVFFSTTYLYSQQATVYFSAGADTLADCFSILKTELHKGNPFNLGQEPQENFKGSGILLSAEPQRWPQYARGLRGMGIEAVLVKSDGKCVLIIGNSQMAVEHGLFIYLEKLGYRYYFPHPDWYIIPAVKNLFPVFSYTGQPSFDHRRIWYAYGTGSKEYDADYQFWFKANRMGGSMDAIVGHAYDDIVYRNRQVFESHPDWLYPALTKGSPIPSNPKFNLANKELVQFVISDVLNRLEAAQKNKKPIKMISMSPSDGPGTCNSPACQQFGTLTDRVYSLINQVAVAVRRQYPGTWVSGMSYSEYSAPPSRKLEPNVFVSVATAFNYSKYSTEDLIRLWSQQAGKVGVYDYLGLYAWDFDLPGQGQASQVSKAVAAIKKYYSLGARGYDAETTPGAINKGLGHYILAHLLWDASTDATAIEKEFFSNCFGKASGIMQGLWGEWENYPYANVRESDLAGWIDILKKAGDMEHDPAVQKRFTHIQLYLHYLFLYNRFKASGSDTDRIALLTYCYNTNDWGAFSGYPALWILGNGTNIPGLKFNDPNAKYKKDIPGLRDRVYIASLVKADRQQLVLKEKLPSFSLSRQFVTKVAPAGIFADKQYAGYKNTTAFTGPHNFILEVKNTGIQNFLKIAADFVTGGGSAKPVTLRFYPYTGVTDPGSQKPVLQYDYTGRMDTQQVSLKGLARGYYLLQVYDPQKIFRIDFSPALSYAVVVTPQDRLNAYTRYMAFYVPAGTKTFRVFKDIEAILISPTGRKVDMSQKGPAETDVPVQPGEAGYWMINFMSGKLHIEGIPPYMAMNPDQLLIPTN